jgi:hypothetical protein
MTLPMAMKKLGRQSQRVLCESAMGDVVHVAAGGPRVRTLRIDAPKRRAGRQHVLPQRAADAVGPGAVAEDGDGAVDEAHDGADGWGGRLAPSSVPLRPRGEKMWTAWGEKNVLPPIMAPSLTV